MTGNHPAEKENGRVGKMRDSRDPTENVNALSEATNRRQDDLRLYLEKYFDAGLEHRKEIDSIRAHHAGEIRRMETERLDSIRQVDVLARNTAADRAADAIQALAATTATNAENLRTALANTASTIAKQTADTATSTAKTTGDMFDAVIKRVASLEASAYRGEGRQTIADPQLAELITEMKSISGTSQKDTGKREGITATVAVMMTVATVVASLMGGIVVSYVNHSSAPASQPQVIYLPSPQAIPPATVVAPTTPR